MCASQPQNESYWVAFFPVESRLVYQIIETYLDVCDLSGIGELQTSSSKFRIDNETGNLLMCGAGDKGRISEREREREREREK